MQMVAMESQYIEKNMGGRDNKISSCVGKEWWARFKGNAFSTDSMI